MKDKFRDRILWGSLFILGPMAALADAPPSPSPNAPGRCDMGMHGPWHPPGPPGGPGADGGPGGGGLGLGEYTQPPPFMREVALTDDQQDKVFAIMHAAAPALREHDKAARKAREALHQLVRSSSFSDSSASALAQAQGVAESHLALQRTKMEHDIYAVLTPDQQSKIASREKECDFQGHGGPQPGGGPPR